MASVQLAGASVPLQQGCRDTLSRAAAQGIPTHILSVNWSAELVAAALGLKARVASG